MYFAIARQYSYNNCRAIAKYIYWIWTKVANTIRYGSGSYKARSRNKHYSTITGYIECSATAWNHTAVSIAKRVAFNIACSAGHVHSYRHLLIGNHIDRICIRRIVDRRYGNRHMRRIAQHRYTVIANHKAQAIHTVYVGIALVGKAQCMCNVTNGNIGNGSMYRIAQQRLGMYLCAVCIAEWYTNRDRAILAGNNRCIRNLRRIVHLVNSYISHRSIAQAWQWCSVIAYAVAE